MTPETVPSACAGPSRDCRRCPRLAAWRDELSRAHPHYYNGAVPAMGPADAGLLIVGLAPGRHGAHATGRAFAGDAAGRHLFRALSASGLCQGGDLDRGVPPTLYNCRITNAVKCLPPKNKPLLEEINACSSFLACELAAAKRVLALGRIAHDAVVRVSGRRLASTAFAHGRWHALGGTQWLLDSYHCSRYNMNTGRITERMLFDVVAEAAAEMGRAGL